MKILEITDAFGLGGTEQAVQIRSELLPKEIFDIKVIGFYGSGPRELQLNEYSISTSVCNGSFSELEKIIASFKPDIISYYRGSSKSELVNFILELSNFLNVPIVIETNVFGRKLIGEVKRYPDYTIHMSFSSLLKYSKLVNKSLYKLYQENHRVIYLPVPVKKFERYIIDIEERNYIRNSIGISANDIVAIRVARPDIRKWSSKLELALSNILFLDPTLKILFMAAPPDKEKHLKKKFGDRIIFLNPTSSIEKISKIYQICDFMLHSSGIGESFGLSLAEGMYWGLPIIVDSTPEMDNAQIEVVDHGQNGFIVDSVNGFSMAVSSLINNRKLLKEFSINAKEKAIKYYSDQNIADKWIKLYIEAMLNKNLIKNTNYVQLNLEIRDDEKRYYESFEQEYNFRIQNILKAADNFVMICKLKYYNILKSISYLSKLDIKSIINIIFSRIISHKIFYRV